MNLPAFMNNTGILYIVATPIGNLDDITQRALSVLTDVDLVACEDTRHSGRMLAHYGIKNKLISYHQHNEATATAKLITQLMDGKSIALISDAGTPLISDPGYPLVFQAHKNKVRVVPVVGASAIIALLCSSGLPTHEFCFFGFLSSKQSQRRTQLRELSERNSTSVIYESSHRILHTMDDMSVIFEESRLISLGRELTKTFETIRTDTVPAILEFLKSDSYQQKGEFVIAIEGKPDKKSNELDERQQALAIMLQKELPPKKAAKITADFLGGNNKKIYQFLIDNKDR